MSERVFVYGSLMRGMEHHGTLAGARCAGEARTAEGFRLFEVSYYPAAVPGGGAALEGEVYEVDVAMLAALDEVEGAPDYFERRRVALQAGGDAWIYVLRAERLPAEARPVTGSSWRTHRG